jgi:CheY-like chemotaxis protein
MEDATMMRIEAKQVAQLQSRLEAKLDYAGRQESVGTVTAAIAHDFENILAEIMGFAESGIQLADAPASCTKRFDSVLKCTRRASHLVGSILDFSPQQERPQEPCDLTEAISETLGTLRASVPPSVQTTENQAVPQGKGERILFVDDEEVLGLVISESLSSLGYQATFAPTPEVALAKHRTERFDVVITDLSIGDYRALKSGRVQKAKITPVWQGVQSVTHNQLCLQQRTDKCMLLSLYEQSKQILQVELWKFGAMPVGPPSPVPLPPTRGIVAAS